MKLLEKKYTVEDYEKLYELLEKTGKGEVLYASFDLYIDKENVYQPDLMVILKGSKAKITSKGVCERAGVEEYWTLGLMEKSVEIYKNAQEGFKLLCRAEASGKVLSEVLELELEISEVFEEV